MENYNTDIFVFKKPIMYCFLSNELVKRVNNNSFLCTNANVMYNIVLLKLHQQTFKFISFSGCLMKGSVKV